MLCEIWGSAFAEMLGERLITAPRNIFILKDGVTQTYRNPRVYGELLPRFQNRLTIPGFGEHFYEEKVAERQALAQFWSKPHLTPTEMEEMISIARSFWVGMFASLSIPNYPDLFSESDRELMSRLRSITDGATEELTRTITASVTHRFPEIGRLAYYVSLEEFTSGQLPPDLEQRTHTELVVIDDQIADLATLTELESVKLFSLERPRAHQDSELHGRTAFPGVVTGKVRIIRREDELHKFEAGEILVSHMTVPDFLPAIHLAAALVTDEGGITCHAAIIARELKKPCIIGTKVASHTLHDGDLVEVDATNGIIRLV